MVRVGFPSARGETDIPAFWVPPGRRRDGFSSWPRPGPNPELIRIYSRFRPDFQLQIPARFPAPDSGQIPSSDFGQISRSRFRPDSQLQIPASFPSPTWIPLFMLFFSVALLAQFSALNSLAIFNFAGSPCRGESSPHQPVREAAGHGCFPIAAAGHGCRLVWCLARPVGVFARFTCVPVHL